MMMMTTAHSRPETKIEEYFVKRVEKDLGGVALKLEVKGRRGWPDRIAVLPMGVTFYVELKAPRGRLSRLQKLRRAQLEDMNQLYVVLSSKDEIDEWIDKIILWTKVAVSGFTSHYVN